MGTYLQINDTESLTLEEAMQLHAIEGNPLDDEQVALQRMFDREGWSDEQRIAYLRKRALGRVGFPAAE